MVSGQRTNTLVALDQKPTKAMYARGKRLFAGAVKAFVHEVVQTLFDNVDTGMSISSVLPLARAVRYRAPMVDIIRRSRAKFWHEDERTGKKYRKKYKGASYGLPSEGEWKSKAHGERIGQRAYTIEWGTPDHAVFTFSFEILVYQYILHENFLPKPQGHKWDSLEKGKKAFMDYIDANSGRILDPTQIVMKAVSEILGTQDFINIPQDILTEDMFVTRDLGGPDAEPF